MIEPPIIRTNLRVVAAVNLKVLLLAIAPTSWRNSTTPFVEYMAERGTFDPAPIAGPSSHREKTSMSDKRRQAMHIAQLLPESLGSIGAG